MSRRVQETHQNSNQAQDHQRDRWVKNNSSFAGEVYDRIDSLEQSMNKKMDNMEKSMKDMNTKIENLESSMNKQMEDIKESIKTFKTSFKRKDIGILFSDSFENE